MNIEDNIQIETALEASVDSTNNQEIMVEKPTSKKSTTTKKRKKVATPKTFKSAFEVLKINANQLQQQSEPDIDNLMTTVEESIVAYKVCKERIDAVQSALDEAFAIETPETLISDDSDNVVDNAVDNTEKFSD